jgi:hypothetical protein
MLGLAPLPNVGVSAPRADGAHDADHAVGIGCVERHAETAHTMQPTAGTAAASRRNVQGRAACLRGRVAEGCRQLVSVGVLPRPP